MDDDDLAQCSYRTKRRKIKALVEEHLTTIRQTAHEVPAGHEIVESELSDRNIIPPESLLSCYNAENISLDDGSESSENENYLPPSPRSKPNNDLFDDESDLSESDVSDILKESENESEQSDVDSVCSEPEELNLREKLAEWAFTYNVSHAALSALLKILLLAHLNLPSDPRTLLATPSQTDIKSIAGGLYYHFGVCRSLSSKLKKYFGDLPSSTSILHLHVNIDGLPLFRSSNLSLWPILGLIKEFPVCDPFVIGIYSGMTKPNSVCDFLNEFVIDVKKVCAEGIQYCHKHFQIVLDAFVCDAPARAFLKCIKNHCGYNACERCVQEGVHTQGRLTFPNLEAELRTDASFMERRDEGHHSGISPLHELGRMFGPVTKFALDYTHLICLGVVRRLLLLWMKGPLQCRQSSNCLKLVSERLVSFRAYLPLEFSRKPRSVFEVKQWKATEFRQFLLYTGPVALRGLLPNHMYRNFMTLSVSMSCLLSPTLCLEFTDYVKDLLKVFVQNFGLIYGNQFLVYNVHSVIHLVDDARNYGSLDNVSSFPFENYLGKLKRMVRRPQDPLAQIVRRIYEKEEWDAQKLDKSVDNMHRKPHFDGPLPPGYWGYQQFQQYYGKCFFISCSQGNNCFRVNDNIVLVKNILLSNDGETIIVCSKFAWKEPFYTHPLPSSRLETYAVGQLSEQLLVVDVSLLTQKFVLLPFKDSFVAVTQLHTP
ncbi:hypothetical protein HOLleu_44145 [Holothuria leucospilota]|uniref:Transposase domain-containing protein n=1 Tax=Holothuria leucospilota TaxID=206669 RepID=A0A9Q0YAQ4_HOLLE|nr:hypothetical protein HOLleu_44145 [Holothuria leucospilota]